MKHNIREQVKNEIKEIQDFPIKGVSFKDISPVLQNINLDVVTELIIDEIHHFNFDIILGIESRGFIFATMLGMKMNKSIGLIRKPGKLPPPVITETCITEYSKTALEIRPGIGRALIVDDVLATGGTANVARDLATKAGYEVVGGFYFIELTYLKPIINHDYVSYIKF